MTILSSILRDDGGVLCSAAFERHEIGNDDTNNTNPLAAIIDSNNNNGGGTNSDNTVVNTQPKQQPILPSILSSSASTNVTANNITSNDLNSSSWRRQQLSAASDVLSRSQARRMKLQQSYNEITSRIAKVEEGATMTIGNNNKGNSGQRHVQLQQQQEIGEEDRDDDNAVIVRNIKSPRVQQLFNFDDVLEENNHHDDNNVEDTEAATTTTTTTAATSKAYHNLPPFGSTISHRNKNDDNNNNNRQQWNNSQLRREHRISVQKSTQIDIAEIEQFTKEMRLKIQLYGVAASSPKKESGVVRDVTVKEGNERNAANEKNEGVGAGDRLKGSSSMRAKKYKRQSYASIKQQINQLHSISSTVKREKEGITRIGGNAEKKGQQHHHHQQHLSDEDRLEAWWKERQRNALRRSGSAAQQSSGERFDNWWEAQREIRKPTTFSDPDPTLKDDNEVDDVNKKKMTPTAPSSKAVDDTIKEVAAFVRQVKATENSPSLQNKSTEKQQQQHVAVDRSSHVVGSSSDSPCPASPDVGMSTSHAEPSSSPVVAEDKLQDKPSPKSPPAAASAAAAAENSATSGALNLILSRIDEAKVQFAKALEEGDVKKQADLAALLARLGEAAVALKKLDQL
jgi:hypothetical protein